MCSIIGLPSTFLNMTRDPDVRPLSDLFVREYLDDSDDYDGLPFTRFLADCIGSGKPVIWEDMI